MFLDCPAYRDRASGERCGLPAEVRCRFMALADACTRVTVTGRGDARAPAAARSRAARQPQEVER